MFTSNDIGQAVRDRYGAIALDVLNDRSNTGCCGTECCGEAQVADPERPQVQRDNKCCGTECCGGGDTISQGLYQVGELDGVPLKAALASLGCGNPTALAELHEGETVLDLGSGGGIDVLLSARRVGPTGFAYGLDMTDQMVELARRNAADVQATNAEFLKGDIANIPLPDNSVDLIISNCVINLAADKNAVLREAYRVLKHGGRFAVSDIVIWGGLPTDLVDDGEMRRDLSAWAGCIAGALTDGEYRDGLAAAGFTHIDLEITRRYTPADLGQPLPAWATRMGLAATAEIVGRFASTFVRATKP